jgi:Zn-dependent protease
LLFNLLPCPGLDGWGIVEPFLPGKVREWGRSAAQFAPILLVLALFFVPRLNPWFWDIVYRACGQIGLDPRLAWQGYGMFQFWR